MKQLAKKQGWTVNSPMKTVVPQLMGNTQDGTPSRNAAKKIVKKYKKKA